MFSSITQKKRQEKKKRNILPIMRKLIKENFKKINIINIRIKSSAKGDKNYEIAKNRSIGKNLWGELGEREEICQPGREF